MSECRIKYIHTKFAKTTFKMYDYNCDIKVVVGQKSFKAHRDVLASSSDYFSAMFSHNMQEQNSNVLTLKEISEIGFSAMIEYFYHGYITLDNFIIEDILEAARFFHVEWLIEVCRHFMMRYLSIQDFKTVMQLASAYCIDDGNFEFDIFEYFCSNFSSLILKPHFLNISPDILAKLLSDDFFINSTERMIFYFILKWVSCNPEERLQYKTNLLSLVRYEFLTPDELEEIRRKFTVEPEVNKLMNEAEEYVNYPSRQCLFNYRARGSKPFLGLFAGIESDISISYKYADVPGFITEYIDVKGLKIDLEFSSCAMIGNCIFFAGGYDKNTWCSSRQVYVFEPSSQKWNEVSMMNDPRVSFSLCSSNNHLYAIAGINHIVVDNIDREIILSSFESYDPNDNAWFSLCPLQYGCYNISSCTVAGDLYVTGGIFDEASMEVPADKTFVYSFISNCWIELSSMNVARHSHASAVLNDKIYVFGGFIKNPTSMGFLDCMQNEVYDIATNQWSVLNLDSPNTNHIFSISTLRADKVYLLGGQAGLEMYLFEYDVEANELKKKEACSAHTHKLTFFETAMPNNIIQQLQLEE